MTRFWKYLLVPVAVAAVGFGYLKTPHGHIPPDLRDAVTDSLPAGKAQNVPVPAAPAPARGGKAKFHFTSDAYGYTIKSNGRTQAFRELNEARAAISKMPNGSITAISFYGHGAPGLIEVGDISLDKDFIQTILKNKMAENGRIELIGCNTAGVTDPSLLRPDILISNGVRYIFHSIVAGDLEVLRGAPVGSTMNDWDANLASDTSRRIAGAVVCGSATFALVPDRAPGVMHVLGTQEATSPATVLAKTVCYKDGHELKAP